MNAIFRPFYGPWSRIAWSRPVEAGRKIAFVFNNFTNLKVSLKFAIITLLGCSPIKAKIY